jgi:protease I
MFGFGRKRRLQKRRIAVLVADGVEQNHLDAPLTALEDAEAEVYLIAPRTGTVRAIKQTKKGNKLPVELAVTDVHPASFDALVLPGGADAVATLAHNRQALLFISAMVRGGKPVAAIGHAARLLAAADVAAGRRITSWKSVQADLEAAGAQWADKDYIVDGKLLTARHTGDVRKFTKQLLKLVGKEKVKVAES